MTVRDEDIRHRLELGEDSRWEFKQVEFAGSRPTSPSRDDLAAEMVAFSNVNGGLLLMGVTDDGLLQGMSREQLVALDNLMVEMSTDSIEPALRIGVHHRELDGKAFVLVEVPRGDSLQERGGRSWIRVGASKRQLTGDERIRLAQRRTQARYLWFDRQAVPDTGFETLSERLWEPVLSVGGTPYPFVKGKGVFFGWRREGGREGGCGRWHGGVERGNGAGRGQQGGGGGPPPPPGGGGVGWCWGLGGGGGGGAGRRAPPPRR
ncbi:MAG: ATP-binding protein, partial [Bryobacterales bacterium]|nr:ATP-binding protein [Bryobacterales bacterium]